MDALDAQIESTSKKLILLSNEYAIKAVEKEIESLSLQKENLSEDLAIEKYTQFNFGTALDEVKEYIENPLGWWHRPEYNDKAMLLQTMFSEKLRYNVNTGFGTAQLSLSAKVFTASTDKNNHMVEMAGIEPASA